MTAQELSEWALAFGFTQAIEIPIYTLALRRGRARPRWLQPPRPSEEESAGTALSLFACLLAAFAASAITHPVVWFVIPRLFEQYWVMVAVAESFAVLVEGVLMWTLGLRYAFLISLAANGASVCLGFLCRALFGVP